MSSQDLLSAALDECGLGFSDLTAQVWQYVWYLNKYLINLIKQKVIPVEETPKLQILQTISVPPNVKVFIVIFINN